MVKMYKLKHIFPLLLLFFSISAFGQMQVKGIVTSAEDGQSIIGATILVEGTAVGTVTDFDGSYSITVPNKDASLNFSYTGLKSQTIAVEGRSQIDLIMSADAALLDEVVVIGYGSQKRSNITGAVSVINSDELTEGSNVLLQQALQGKTSGVLVTKNSGSPGAEAFTRIRGISTINDASPLYIVDGLRVEGLDYLNPNDIESVSVLKDAASAAIYGASAGNGVILITTKGGKRNQVGKISYSGSFGLQTVARKLNLLNSEEYAIIQNESYIAAGQKPLAEFANPAALGEGTDWQDALFGVAPNFEHQLTFAGGGEKSSYLISGNYTVQEGIVGVDIGEGKSRFERFTARFNGDHDIKPWFSIGNRLSFTNFTRNALAENNQFNTPLIRAINIDPTTPVFKDDGTYAYSRYADTDIANPINAVDQTYYSWNNNRIVGSVFADLKPIKNLTIRTNYSADASFAQENSFSPIFDLSNDPELNDAPAIERPEVNSVGVNNYKWTGWQWENTAEYKFLLQDRHDFTLLAGTTARYNNGTVTGASGTDLPSNDPEFAFINNTVNLVDRSSSGYFFEGAGSSVFGRVTYSFNDKYIVNASLRRDGSTKFGPNNRFGTFPAVSLGWNVTNEDFFTIEKINLLKVRASWGVNGNDRIADWQYIPLVQDGQNYTFGTEEVITNGSTSIQAANPDIKWEESTQTNLGINVEMMDSKLEFIVDYFNKETKDMLYAAPIPFHVGAEAPTQNIADMVNRGWEFTLAYRNNDNKLKYGFNANFTTIDTEITGLGNGGEPIFTGNIQSAGASVIKTDVGLPLAAFWGYEMDGLFQNDAEVEAHAFQNDGTAPGDIRFKDLNDDGVIDQEDQTVIGSALPDFSYGLSGNLGYGGFDLNVSFYGSQGNEIYNNTTRYDFTYVNRPNSVLNRWTGEGTSNFEPRVNLSDPNQNARISTRFVENGSFLRLQNVELGYKLPTVILQKIKFYKLRAYVSAQNLVTWTNYSGFDPEIGQINRNNGLELGIDHGFYPSARGFLMGIQAEF